MAQTRREEKNKNYFSYGKKNGVSVENVRDRFVAYSEAQKKYYAIGRSKEEALENLSFLYEALLKKVKDRDNKKVPWHRKLVDWFF